MINQQKKDKFIELRLQGETFENIAKELKVSKQTLITWNKSIQVKDVLEAGKLIRYQSILNQYGQQLEHKIEVHSKLLKRIDEELAKRKLDSISTGALIKLQFMIQEKLYDLVPVVRLEGDNAFYNKYSSIDKPYFNFDPKE